MAKRLDSHDDVYDRQIRLWGADAQKRMCNARVLYIRLSGVTCEIMKNLVLAGVAAVVCDDRPYPGAVREMPCSFFCAEEMEAIIAGGNDGEATAEHEGGEPNAKKAKTFPTTVASAIEPKIEELNPLLAGRNGIEERPISSLPDEYFAQFDAIVASRLTAAEATRISLALQKVEKPEAGSKESNNDESGNGDDDNNEQSQGTLFIVTDTFGFDGCAHLDFGRHHAYRRELGKDKLSDVLTIQPYVSMSDMLNVPLAEVKGRWDKVVPRILVLQRLFMDYWENVGSHSSLESKDDKQRRDDFVKFTENWIAAKAVSKESCFNDGDQLGFEQLADIAHHPEISPVSAVLGGVLGNEVIKALTGKGEPANNILMFSGLDGGCRSFLLGSD